MPLSPLHADCACSHCPWQVYRGRLRGSELEVAVKVCTRRPFLACMHHTSHGIASHQANHPLSSPPPPGCAARPQVQRPGALAAVSLDIYILRLGLGALRRVAGIGQDIRLVADELGRGLYGALQPGHQCSDQRAGWGLPEPWQNLV